MQNVEGFECGHDEKRAWRRQNHNDLIYATRECKRRQPNWGESKSVGCPDRSIEWVDHLTIRGIEKLLREVADRDQGRMYDVVDKLRACVRRDQMSSNHNWQRWHAQNGNGGSDGCVQN